MELTGTNRPTQHTHARHTRASKRASAHARASISARESERQARESERQARESMPRTTPTGVGVHYTVHDQPPPHTLVRTTPVRTRGRGTHENRTRGTHPRHHPQGGGPWARPYQARPGGHSGGATPGPIPNPEAKTPSADGTAPARVRKSRTPPGHHNTTTQEVPRSERVHMTRTCSRQVPHCIVFSLTRGGAVR